MSRLQISLAGLAGVLILALAALAGRGMSLAAPVALFEPFNVPTAAVVLISAFAGAGLTAVLLLGRIAADRSRDLFYGPMPPVACLAAALLLLMAIDRGILPGHRAAVAFLLLVLAVAAGLRSLDLLAKGQSLGFESYWGGLGGGGGGWRILPPTGLAILALSFGAGAVALVTIDPNAKPAEAPKTQVEASANKSKAAASPGRAGTPDTNAAAPAVPGGNATGPEANVTSPASSGNEAGR